MRDFIDEWVDGASARDPREYIVEWVEGRVHRCLVFDDFADAREYAMFLADGGAWPVVHESERRISYPGKAA
jgi:hypothetical protein